MLRVGLYIFLLVAASPFVKGQQARHFAFTHYGSSAGIASNEVMGVTQDESGYIWIATTNGLQRFDGVRFRTFRHKKDDPNSIPANVVWEMMIDRKKKLWIQTGGDKIGIFDTKTFVYRDVSVKASNPDWVKSPKGMVQDEYGNIFLVIANTELLTYNEAKNEFSPSHNFIRMPKDWKIISLLQVPGTKKYWVGTNNGLALYNAVTDKLSYFGNNVEKEDVISRLGHIKGIAFGTMDRRGRVWFQVWKDGAPLMYLYNTRSNSLELSEHRLLPPSAGYHELGGVMVQRDSTVWIKGLNLFGMYNEKTRTFDMVHNGYENEQSISYNRVFDLYEDRDRNIWVATANNGLYRFTPSEQFFTNVRHTSWITNKPGEGSMMSFMYTRDGNLFAGAWGEGLYRFDPAFKSIPLNIKGLKEKSTPSIWGMATSADSNTVWLGAQPGIFRLNMVTREAQFFNPSMLQKRTVRQVAEDRFGNLWIGMQSTGVYKWDKAKGAKNFEEGMSSFAAIPAAQILKLYIDRSGLLWVCTTNRGVYVVDPATDKVVLHLGTTEPVDKRLLWDGVAAVIQYDDTTMAIAANGLHLYNTRLQKITRTISLPESIPGSIAAMEKDALGYLWVSMTSGIFRVNPRNEIFIHFDRVDGIANDYFIIGASTTLPDGKIVFGADNQLVYFDPLKVHINDPAPDITITGFKLMNRSLPVDSLVRLKSIDLKPGENSVTIEFSGMNYNGTYIISYRLEGLEKEWQRADNTSQAVYSHLPPGTYTFLARGEDAEGHPSKNITKLVIHVKPPFWKTWWFFCLLALLVAAIIYWLDKQRVNKLIALQEVRSEIAGNLHEEVNTTLNNINLLSEMARIKADRDITRSKQYIDQISTKSHNMINAMDDILWSIDPRNDTMEKSLLRMMEFADELKKRYDASIEIALDKKVRALKLDMKTRHEVFIIFKEALRMIVQHSGGKQTLVHIDLFRNKLSLKLQDPTASFDKNTEDINALVREMSDRANSIDAELDVQHDSKGVAVVLLVASA